MLTLAQQAKLQADLKAAYIDQNNDPHFWAEFELWDSACQDARAIVTASENLSNKPLK